METTLVVGVLVFLAVMALAGYKKGFIKVVLSLCVTVVAMVAAVVLAPPCETFIKEQTPLYDTVKEQMADYVSEYLGKGVDAASKQVQEDAVKQLKLPASIQKQLIENNPIDAQTEQQVESFSNYVAESLADILLNSVTVLLLFLILKIALRVVIGVLDVISHLPVINGVNKMLGAAIGAVEGILILWVVCIALTAISGTKLGTDIFAAIAMNPILSFIYNNNLLVQFIL